jgi:hypothetical protein
LNDDENKSNTIVCEYCKKQFFTQSGKWKHDKMYHQKNKKEKKQSTIEKLIVTQEKLEKKIEILEHKPPSVINNITNNNTNNFNINVFLNEKCSEAINFTEFIDTLKNEFTREYFERILENGYNEERYNLLTDNLNKICLYKRPLHYRMEENTIHIRDKNMWNEEIKKTPKLLNDAIEKMSENEYDTFFDISIKIGNGDVNNYENFEELKYKILEEHQNPETDENLKEKLLHYVKL